MKSRIYRRPEYYEIAFSFVDQARQVRVFEKFIKKFSKRKVHRVLDIACGTALQLRELAKQGYEAYGLDASAEMLSYLKQAAHQEKLAIHTICADMTHFTIPRSFDFAYIMMGSIVYVKSDERFLTHLDSVAKVLRPGGLYLIENIPLSWSRPDFFKPQRWSMKRDGISVKAFYQISPHDPLRQIVTQTISLNVNDHGKRMTITDLDQIKLIFPEEFKTLVAQNGKFEFLGFFMRDAVRPLKSDDRGNIALLRRK